ncbi:MAG: hypothetical protein JO269_01040 [Burkholderiaceae bacterium]|nr:hypothetical protein [Burkholderiaceae bacterium]
MHRLRGLLGLHNLPFGIEIALALAAKLLILFWIWHAFFSAPQAKHMRVPADQVAQHLLAARPTSPAQPDSSINSPTPEISHDPHR